MPDKHTSSSERMMLTNITGLINKAQRCSYADNRGFCPLLDTLLAIKKSLKTELRNKGENDRD